VERVTLEGEAASVELRLPDGSRRGEILVREGSTWRVGIPPEPGDP
jgi:hypothetical protein